MKVVILAGGLGTRLSEETMTDGRIQKVKEGFRYALDSDEKWLEGEKFTRALQKIDIIY